MNDHLDKFQIINNKNKTQRNIMRTALFISAIIAFTNLAQAVRLSEPQLAQVDT